jgi:CDGSH-type Zn-finger protein
MSSIEIRILDNGPLLVTGTVTLSDADGGVFATDQDTIALCRCGHSANRPFCDGSHKRNDFADSCRANG